MSFNSIEYLLFLPTVIVLYFLLPFRYRWMLLVPASYFFYMWWRVKYALVIAALTVLDYFCGLLIERTTPPAKRRLFLLLSLAGNLGILFTFKYFNFFTSVLDSIFTKFQVPHNFVALNIILPLGISFHTFQTMGYVIDVYRRQQKAERHFGYFALYVCYFPQLVAGPIERAKNLLHQLKADAHFSAARTTSGLRLILFGLVKKVVVADRLAEYVNFVYARPQDFGGGVLALATLFFGFQIYWDFSGYTDIARGSSRLMGVELMENFKAPYFARSIPEFWQRWHISLSTWFRDYVYISLGGSRFGFKRWILAVMAVFTISGLWHGANYTYIIWGFLHGVGYLVCRMLMAAPKPLYQWIPQRLRAVLAWAATFSFAMFLWIFFRAANLTDALYVCRQVLFFPYETTNWAVHGTPKLLQNFFFIGLLLLVETKGIKEKIREWLSYAFLPMRWAFYYATVLMILFFGVFSNAPQFIYFQF